MSEADEITKSILVIHSSDDYTQTIARTVRLHHDISRVIDALLREARSAREMNESWLEIQARYQRRKTFLQRLFT